VIVIAIPVLGRAHQIEPLLSNIASATTVEHQVVLVCTPTDIEGKEACETSGAKTLVAAWWPGPQDFARKINHVYRETEGEWIFQGATDIEFSPGWDIAALEAAESGALVIGTNDEGNPSVISGNHSTHTLVARSYCDDPGASMDGPGTVFSVQYEHNFTDQELVSLAKSRGVWAFSPRSIVRHDHPHWGRAPMDKTYELGLSGFNRDRITFNRRRMLWA
jgi:hypothetical protein